MPLSKCIQVSAGASIAVWEIEESEDELLLELDYDAHIHALLSTISHSDKRKQLLAGRAALHHLLRQESLQHKGIQRLSTGQPIVDADAELVCSISHTEGICAAMLGRKPLGIDIEKPHATMQRIADKYASEREKQWAGGSLERFAQLWCGKEACYKRIARGDVFLKSHFFLQEITPREEEHKEEKIVSFVFRQGALNTPIKVAYQTFEGRLLAYTLC